MLPTRASELATQKITISREGRLVSPTNQAGRANMFPLPGQLASLAIRHSHELAALAMETLARGRVGKTTHRRSARSVLKLHLLHDCVEAHAATSVPFASGCRWLPMRIRILGEGRNLGFRNHSFQPECLCHCAKERYSSGNLPGSCCYPDSHSHWSSAGGSSIGSHCCIEERASMRHRVRRAGYRKSCWNTAVAS
jgi:hypothetical protein